MNEKTADCPIAVEMQRIHDTVGRAKDFIHERYGACIASDLLLGVQSLVMVVKMRVQQESGDRS